MGAEEEPLQSKPEQSAEGCQRCGGAMALVRSTPGIGSLPELLTYRCAQCGDVETVEAR